MITVGNVINDDAFKRLMKASGFLRSMDVKVGIVGSKDSIRKDEPERPDSRYSGVWLSGAEHPAETLSRAGA